MEDSTEIPVKSESRFTIQPSHSAPEIYLNKMKPSYERLFHTPVLIADLFTIADMESTQMSVTRSLIK